MKQLSRTEWIGVGVAIVVVFAVLGPGFGLFSGLGQDNAMNVIPNEEEDVTGETVEVAPGVRATVVKEGEGDIAEAGNLVAVHYRGTFADGTQFDSSYDRGQPFSFTLGGGQVIPGWDLGVQGMREGEVRRLEIAPEMAYGPQGITDPRTGEVIIPENATLFFEVELLDAGISRPDAEATLE